MSLIHCFSQSYFIVTWLILGIFSFPAIATDLTLKVISKDLKVGTLNVELYQLDPEQPNKRLVVQNKTFDFNPTNKITTYHLIGLEPGELCLRMFLDQNGNQQIDMSSMGIPLEPVGFANNPALFFGEPSIEKACFIMQETNNAQTIKLESSSRKHKTKK